MTLEDRFRSFQMAIAAGIKNPRQAVVTDDDMIEFSLRSQRRWLSRIPGLDGVDLDAILTPDFARALRQVEYGMTFEDVPHYASNERDTEVLYWPRYKEMIECAAEYLDRDISVDSFPPLGTLPSFNPNACCLNFDVGNPGLGIVVAFTAGLPQFLNRMAKIVNIVHAFIDPREYDKRHEADWPGQYLVLAQEGISLRPELIDLFSETFLAFYTADMSNLTPHLMPVEGGNLATMANEHRRYMVRGAERFIVAHEIAHFLLGHLDSRVRMIDATIGDAAILERSREQEYEADKLAANLAIKVTRQTWPERDQYYFYAVETSGVSLFFDLARLMEKVDSLRPCRTLPDTHPPARLRLVRWMENYESAGSLPSNPFSLEFKIILHLLWQRAHQSIMLSLSRADSEG